MLNKLIILLFLCCCVNKDVYLVKEYKYSDYCKNQQIIKNCSKFNTSNTFFEMYITKNNNKQLNYPIKLFEVSIVNNDLSFKLFSNEDRIIKLSDNIIYNNIFSELCEWGYLPNTYHEEEAYVVKFNKDKSLEEQIKTILNIYLNKYGILYK